MPLHVTCSTRHPGPLASAKKVDFAPSYTASCRSCHGAVLWSTTKLQEETDVTADPCISIEIIRYQTDSSNVVRLPSALRNLYDGMI